MKDLKKSYKNWKNESINLRSILILIIVVLAITVIPAYFYSLINTYGALGQIPLIHYILNLSILLFLIGAFLYFNKKVGNSKLTLSRTAELDEERIKNLLLGSKIKFNLEIINNKIAYLDGKCYKYSSILPDSNIVIKIFKNTQFGNGYILKLISEKPENYDTVIDIINEIDKKIEN